MNRGVSFLAIMLFVLISTLIVPKVVKADSYSFTVNAVVLPTRTIYVDSSNTIVKIASNTNELVKPVVYSSTSPTIRKAYSLAISNQYNQILTNCKVNPTGIIYDGNCESKNYFRFLNLKNFINKISIIDRLTL